MTERRRVMRQMDKIGRLKSEERAKVAAGKTPFFLKQSKVRELALEDRYDELKGSGKLRKFVEKKRRKNTAKDRRWMPEEREG